MQNGINDLVPVDELHWDKNTNSFSILSNSQTEDVIEACLRMGMNKSSDITKVIKEYERVMSGVLLFNQLLAGRIGIYDFDEEGSPIFEKIKDDQVREIEFLSFENESDAYDAGDPRKIGDRFVVCDSSSDWDLFALYKAVVDFCSHWGLDILEGENPENHALAVDDPKFLSALRKRGWSVLELEVGEDHMRMKIKLTGSWLRTKYDS